MVPDVTPPHVFFDFLHAASLAFPEAASRKVQMTHDKGKHNMPSVAGTTSNGLDDDAYILIGDMKLGQM